MKDNSDLPYDVCSVHMNTCARLYRKWRNTRLRYRKAPVDGIPVKVEYVDVYPLPSATLHAVNSPPLTALCLHGAPGSHRDFRHLIVHLTARNIRVVAPNFPGTLILSLILAPSPALALALSLSFDLFRSLARSLRPRSVRMFIFSFRSFELFTSA